MIRDAVIEGCECDQAWVQEAQWHRLVCPVRQRWELRADLQRAYDLLLSQPYRVHERLLSPLCGAYVRHPDCRSAICECDCHVPSEEADR